MSKSTLLGTIGISPLFPDCSRHGKRGFRCHPWLKTRPVSPGPRLMLHQQIDAAGNPWYHRYDQHTQAGCPGRLLRVKREAGANPAQQPLLCFGWRLHGPLDGSLRRRRGRERSRRSVRKPALLVDSTLFRANGNGRRAWMEASALFRHPPVRGMLHCLEE